jgi:serine/threonine protein kinase
VRSAAQGSELRRHVRLAVDLDARRKTGDSFTDERVLNLSTGGLALATNTKLPLGSLEQLVVIAPDQSFQASLQAEVVRLHGTKEAGSYVAGLRFRVLDAAAIQKIEELMLSALTMPRGKRAAPRLEVRHEVFWSSGGWSGASQLELINVSQTGALLSGQQTPPPNALGLLSLRADGSDDLLAVPAQIVWVRKEGEGQLAGVRFGSDPSATLLVRRILQRLLFHHPRPAEDAPAAAVGTKIGEYELGAKLCRGQACEIYRATGASGPVALKRFCGNPADVEAWTGRFLSQARLGPRLSHHPGVVKVYSAIADAEECWLATELYEGPSLEQRMVEAAKTGKRLPVAQVVDLAIKLLSTLEDCHSYMTDDDGEPVVVLHGDIRPSNVLFGPDGSPKLLGFGVPFEARAERLAWLPPEALRGREVGPHSDVYQVGVLLYEALSGVLPFRADSSRTLLNAILDGPAPLEEVNPDVPEAIANLVRAALREDPRTRPQSALELAEALSDLDLALLQPANPDFEIDIVEDLPTDQLPAYKPFQHVPVPAPAPLPTEPPPAGSVQPGDRIGRYQVVGKLTEGGMAELFVTRAEGVPWPVVVKTIHPAKARESEVVTLFMNEARLVSQIEHPNIVRITDIGFDRLSPFIAMEYFASRTLAQVVIALAEAGKPMPIELAAYVIAEVCAGLECAHTLRDMNGKPQHVVHRDVTAKNILIGYSGGVKVVDFGIARAATVPRSTSPGHIRGTAGWVSPEQVQGAPVTPATDVWALGVNLYMMLVGALPVKGKSDPEVLAQILDDEPIGVRRIRPEVPADLADVLPRALAKSPVDRFPSAADMRDETLPFVPADARARLQALMESLFPTQSDPERLRVAKLAPEDSAVMPGDAESPLSRLMGWLKK